MKSSQGYVLTFYVHLVVLVQRIKKAGEENKQMGLASLTQE